MDKIKKILNRETVLYIIFGVATTAVNYVVFYLLYNVLWSQSRSLEANAAAFVAAVIFAFVVNKLFVFASKSWKAGTVLPELWKFVSARILSGLMETGILFLFVELLKLPDGLVKVAAGVLVILLNYAVSKWLIFKKG
jgi:putative flippase GtrA